MRTKLTFTILALSAIVSLHAQSFQEGFLLNNYRLSFRYNPALHAEGDFISVGEFTSYSSNNIGAGAFLYPLEGQGKVVTGLNSAVSSEEFLGALKDINAKQTYLEYSLFSYGFARGEAYHTVEAGVRASYGVAVPKDVFRFLKIGGEDAFSFADTRVQGRLYMQLAYGYSRKIGDRLSVGARAKLLAGLYGGEMRFNRFDLRAGGDSYRLDIQSHLDLTNLTGKMMDTEGGFLNPLDWSSKDKWRMPSGGGAALDLGISWEIADGLTLAASVLDLGGCFWYYGNAAQCDGTATITGLKDFSLDDINLSGALNQARQLGNELLKTVQYVGLDRHFEYDPLPMQANVGLRYKMPFCEALTVGLTGNYAAYRILPYWEGRLALAVNPFDWLDVTANIGTGKYGMVWGAAAQIRVLRFRAHAGIENGFGGTVPYEGTPLKANKKALVVGLTYDL
ncbi:MAG: hypothetical protein IJJ72_04660 [Bacteroidales bacterium]|nr:hypothetical protein [Bacteroidales bacterium]